MSTYESLVDSAVATLTSTKLQSMSDEQLKELLQDDTKIDELVQQSTQLQSLRSEKELLVASNRSLATYNLNQEPKIRECKDALMKAYEEAMAAKETLDEKRNQLIYYFSDGIVEQRSLETSLALLLTAAAEAEEESEQSRDKLVDAEISVEQFVKEFLPKRTLSHTRRVKADKMRDVMRSGGTSTATPNSLGASRPAPQPPGLGGPAWPAQRAQMPRPPNYQWNYTGTV